ncbi:MAG: class I SAM-dependent methyltransferase [Chloroflexota bacterium]
MPQKFPVERAEELINPRAAAAYDPHQVIAGLPLRPFQNVADIGCGPGYLTIPLAKYLYDGKVYAVDVQQGMLDILNERVQQSRLSNVETVLSKENQIPLDDGAVDGVVLAHLMHEAESPNDLLNESKRVLARGGWIAVLDWHRKETEAGPPLEERISASDAAKVLGENGLNVQAVRDIGDTRYLIIVRP